MRDPTNRLLDPAAWQPHDFAGRADRWCEICNRPDRHPAHIVAVLRARAETAEAHIGRLRGDLEYLLKALQATRPAPDGQLAEFVNLAIDCMIPVIERGLSSTPAQSTERLRALEEEVERLEALGIRVAAYEALPKELKRAALLEALSALDTIERGEEK